MGDGTGGLFTEMALSFHSWARVLIAERARMLFLNSNISVFQAQLTANGGGLYVMNSTIQAELFLIVLANTPTKFTSFVIFEANARANFVDSTVQARNGSVLIMTEQSEMSFVSSGQYLLDYYFVNGSMFLVYDGSRVHFQNYDPILIDKGAHFVMYNQSVVTVENCVRSLAFFSVLQLIISHLTSSSVYYYFFWLSL